MNALARREHSQKEILQKISPKFPLHKHLIIDVLHQLEEDGLQSDIRFAEAFLRARVAKAYGVNRIAIELSQKGVDETVIEQTFLLSSVDWQALLLELFEKKYQSEQPVSLEEKAKMSRFFQYRGFSNEQIKSLFKL